MNILRSAILVAISLAVLSSAVLAQKPKPTPKKQVATAAPATSMLELKDGADKVAVQIMNVTKFLYLLGSIAKGIEDVDRDPKANTAALALNATNKKAFTQTIRNLQAGMAVLEVEFKTKPALKKYLVQIQGVTDLVGESHDLAVSGKYTESGRPLVSVVERLASTLVALP